MSGLESIAGLSLACNVMQLISFGHETVSLCRRVHESGSPEPGLDKHAEGLGKICDNLDKLLAQQHTLAAVTGISGPEKDLQDLASKCTELAKKLKEELGQLSPSRLGKFGALLVAPRILWRKGRLERLKSSLDDAQRLMDTSIIERLFARTEASYKMNDKNFSNLSQELRQFIADNANSDSILRKLIETQAKEFQDHVTMEYSKTQEAIKSHMSLELTNHGASVKNHVSLSSQGVQDAISQRMITSESSKAKEQAYQQLLKSLKYPGMNERRNQISQSHPKTFRWIFNDAFRLSNSDSESDGESEWLTEDDSSTHSDEPAGVDTTSIRSEESVELSASSRSPTRSLRPTEPQPWDSFVDWLKDETHKIYWISGKPGSGKSTLMKYIEANDSTIKHDQLAIQCISHYLWRPGTFMQYSIKGVLCSLLHQVLALDKSHATQVLKRQPSLSTKDTDTDWTAQELERILLAFLQESTYKYLVLLDGLDEVADTPDDGVDRLLGLINGLTTVGQVKVCVSSRPEPALKRALEKHPMLKIQDLTSRDIYLLTQERLEAMETDLEKDTTDDLLRLICEKADGVFIWVVLVMNSLQRGLANYDDLDTLYSRVESLPKDLTKLYKEMWSRMEEDSELYREKAVLLFHMAMELKAYHHHSYDWVHMDNLFGLAISTDDEMLESFMTHHEIPDAEVLFQKRHRLRRTLPAMCAGLLDITDPEEAFSSRNTYESRFKPWSTTDIHFTHRTAIDFICNSAEGKELFGAYVPKQDDLLSRAIKTDLMLRRIIIRTDISTITSPFNNSLSVKYALNGPLLPSLISFQNLAKISSRQSVNSLLSFSYQCLEIMELSLENRGLTSQSRKAHHTFLAEACSDAGFTEWAKKTLQAATVGVKEVTPVESFALRGACEGIVALEKRSLPEVNACRLSIIRRIMRKYSISRQGLDNGTIRTFHPAYFRDISSAWRCLLIHTLEKGVQKELNYHEKDEEEILRWWTDVMKAIRSFLSANVLEDFKTEKYMISIVLRTSEIMVIPARDYPMFKSSGEILFEVNDSAILALITEFSERALGSCSLPKLQAEPAYCPLAAPKLFVEFDTKAMLKLGVNEVLLNGIMDGQGLLRMLLYLKTENLDRLRSMPNGPILLLERKVYYNDYLSALRAVGYELGAANRDYRCFDDDIFER